MPNDQRLQLAEKRTSIMGALRKSDDILREGVESITDNITVHVLI